MHPNQQLRAQMYQKRTLAIKTLTCYFEEAQWISQWLSLTPSLALILTKQDYTTHICCFTKLFLLFQVRIYHSTQVYILQ